jgi:ABC transporter substrate binding protein
VILAAGLDAVVALRNVTQTIPVVSATLADAVHLGLIANEARPTGNVTGLEPYVAGLPAKQMEFAREVVPSASKVGLLTNLSDPKAPPQAQELLAAARSPEVEVTSSDANRPDEIDSALEMLANRHLDVVIVLQTSMLLGNSRQIAASALAKRLPTVYGYRAHVVAGGLASYGVDLEWCWRRSASFVDKILHGARPGVERNTSVARRWSNIARKAVAPAGYWLALGLIAFLGLSAVINIEATKTRLFLVVVVIGIAFSVASLLERLLKQPADDEGWPRWYSQINTPTLYHSTDDAPYSYVVLPRPMTQRSSDSQAADQS